MIGPAGPAGGPGTSGGGPSASGVAWLDCRIGVAGDMLLGALVDAGADAAAVSDAVGAVSRGAVAVRFERVRRAGFAAVRAIVEARGDAGRPEQHRGLAEIEAMIARAGLEPSVADSAIAVFRAIGDVEAERHGCALAEVHFHEVGALDTIADVVGAMAAWHSLGWPAATASVVGVGAGVVSASHGPMSVPAPAVTGLLTRAGAPSWAGPLAREATTPTGAALVTFLAASWGDQPPMTVRAQGFGAGSADPPGVANVTRVLVGAPLPSDDRAAPGPLVAEVRANVDDLDPRVWPSVIDALLADGALDAWLTPITMKHGRPAQCVTVLCAVDRVAHVRARIFELTPTLGVRWQELPREVLDREWVAVPVLGHQVAVKVGRRAGVVVTTQPEWRDVQRVAQEVGMPARTVLELAKQAVKDVT